MLTTKSLYPHLSEAYLQQNESFNNSYNVSDNYTESDKLLHQKLSEELDLLTPILNTTGWRQNEIDALSNITDPYIANILASRMKTLNMGNPNNYTDEQLVEMAIPRNLTSSEISNYAYEANELKQSCLELIELEKLNATAPAPAPAPSIGSIEPTPSAT